MTCRVMAITDGEENRSSTSGAALKKLIRECELTDRWTFAFLVPSGYASRFAHQFGINEGNIQEWEATRHGTEQYQRSSAVALSNYFVGRGQGVRSVQQGFFTDMKDVKVADVKKQFSDMKSRVKVLPVPSEAAIRPFCEAKLGHYPKGQCYYELTKPETVQSYKQILVQKKRQAAIFGGTAEEMRQLIGIPGTSNGKIRLKPGLQGDWNIFIQSTSVNRKLVRGTRLLVVQ